MSVAEQTPITQKRPHEFTSPASKRPRFLSRDTSDEGHGMPLMPADGSQSSADDNSNEQPTEESSPLTAADPTENGDWPGNAAASSIELLATDSQTVDDANHQGIPFSVEGQGTQNQPPTSNRRVRIVASYAPSAQETPGHFDATAMSDGNMRRNESRQSDMRSLSANTYIPDTDAWAMQSGGVDSLSAGTYIPDTDAWARQCAPMRQPPRGGYSPNAPAGNPNTQWHPNGRMPLHHQQQGPPPPRPYPGRLQYSVPQRLDSRAPPIPPQKYPPRDMPHRPPPAPALNSDQYRSCSLAINGPPPQYASYNYW
ncbi:hypothetical protein AJ80_03171 [Polytolypa hystricis UAMH7299]|uniref:Uncharacterized protein n=1 Tax=Polytolypa hystricis (strain UAMH7299) TaxID=1447883 RepID=A0A2B7YKG2_POLH7|nr:hypothetical protein AJ80_03171 [Polytolypa hystricis UAMH7299]